MRLLLFLSVLISFFSALVILPKWIKKCKQTNLMWQDMNKFDKPKNVAASGGLVVVMAFALGVLFYVAIRTFIVKDSDGITLQIFALSPEITGFLSLSITPQKSHTGNFLFISIFPCCSWDTSFCFTYKCS
jgi:hypothetical protein